MRPPLPPAFSPSPVVVRLAADGAGGPSLTDLKALTLGHLEGGADALQLDLRATGPLDRRAIGTLLYVVALYHEAGGELRLSVTPEQRAALAPYTVLVRFSEDGDSFRSPPPSYPPLP